MTALLSISDINTKINHEPRMLDIRLAEALQFNRPRTIRELIKRHMDALKSLGNIVCRTVRQTSKGGRPTKEYWLTKKQALYLCTKSETPNATEVTIRMVEVFDEVTSGKTVIVREHTRRRPQRQQRTPEQFAASIPQCDLLTTGLGHLAQAAEAHPELRLIQTANACLKRFDEALNRPLSLSMIHHVVSQGGRA